MKKTFFSLLLAATLAAGCGSSADFLATGDGAAGGTFIPSAGGEVALPAGTGFFGSMIFDPGASPGTRISLSASLTPPDGANIPLVGLTSPDATTEPFFYVTFNVSQPTPLSLLEGIRLQGPLPVDHEHYHADLHALDNDVLAQGDGGTFLQEIPGELAGDVAVFDEVVDGGVLEPGKDYLVRFKSTDQDTLTLKVVNDSGVSPCYVFITGRNPNLSANDPRFYWVSPDGQFRVMDTDDLVNGFADYNIPLPADGKIKLPLMSAGRVYVSLGEKIKTQLNPGTQPADPPAFWVAPQGWWDGR